MDSLQTPLARVRGLGSAKSGTTHFIYQRLTAIALIPLLLYLTVLIISLGGAQHAQVVKTLSSPWVSVLFISTLVALFYHLQLGLQVIIEDYIHHEAVKVIALIAMRFVVFLCGAMGILALLRIATGG